MLANKASQGLLYSCPPLGGASSIFETEQTRVCFLCFFSSSTYSEGGATLQDQTQGAHWPANDTRDIIQHILICLPQKRFSMV